MLRDERSIDPLILEVLASIRTPQPSQGPALLTRVSNTCAEIALALRRVVGNPETLALQREWV
jgi:hypothetical protein